ncbi:MAG: GNAT family N-acetyltransferase [Kiloniellaceae bacterium]
MSVSLETDRLVLRPFAPEDAAAVPAFAGRWEVAHMTARIPHPYPADAAAVWIAGHAAARAEGSEFTFAVTLKEGGEVIGAASLRRSEPGNFELGYVLAPEAWGRGLATEAARALVVYGFEKLGAEALTSGHFTDNPASGRVLEKAGFRANGIARQWSEARQEFVDSNRFLLTRRTWEGARQAAAGERR